LTKQPHNPIISEKEVEHLAELAKLELSKKEFTKLRGELNEILSYFRLIDEVDTENILPTYHVQDLVNVLRDDVPTPQQPDALLKDAPQKKDRFIKAPRMI
jgi:aspartyl-tRNA(Asn)/glutamyl-tRNA(Gln) amidotransferase subunit C